MFLWSDPVRADVRFCSNFLAGLSNTYFLNGAETGGLNFTFEAKEKKFAMDDSEVADLWKEFARTRDPNAKQKLWNYYSGFVEIASKSVLKKYPHLTVEEVLGEGHLGLEEAIEDFDPNLGNSFWIYSMPRIKGKIKDFIREAAAESRQMSRKTKIQEAASLEFYGTHGRPPSEEELISEVSRRIEASRDVHTRNLDPHDVAVLHKPLVLEGLGDVRSSFLPFDSQLSVVDRIILRDNWNLLLKGLDRRQKLIIKLFYQGGMTNREIGQIVGLKESMVSRIHRQLLVQLKDRINILRLFRGDSYLDREAN